MSSGQWQFTMATPCFLARRGCSPTIRASQYGIHDAWCKRDGLLMLLGTSYDRAQLEVPGESAAVLALPGNPQ